MGVLEPDVRDLAAAAGVPAEGAARRNLRGLKQPAQGAFLGIAMGGASQLARFVNRFLPADNSVRRFKLLAGALFVLAGLTLFLTYVRIEYPPSDPWVDLTPSSIESFTGVQLMTGSYHSESPRDAEEARWDAYLVASAALLGLATLPSRRNKAAAIALFIALIVTLMFGCATAADLDNLLGGGPDRKLGYGFGLGVLLLAGATAVRVYLWLSTRDGSLD